MKRIIESKEQFKDKDAHINVKDILCELKITPERKLTKNENYKKIIKEFQDTNKICASTNKVLTANKSLDAKILHRKNKKGD